MSRRDAYIEVEYGEILHSTDDAILFNFEGEEIWISRRVIENHDRSNNLIEIPSWLAEKEGII